MLTIKQIIDNKEAVINGLKKKHFKNAEQVIEQVLAIDNKRKEAQARLDNLNAQINSTSKSIGMLMKQGKKEEAEEAKLLIADCAPDVLALIVMSTVGAESAILAI